jgi:N-acetylglutamate synthase-like GNAT family acetyltransferase
MIRRCTPSDFEEVHAVINDAAQAYKGVIPDDCWHEPYMPTEELEDEICKRVQFWVFEEDGRLIGVMGIQDKGRVALIHHACVRTSRQHGGIGTQLLRHLESLASKPILVGTWQAASCAICFYERNGYVAQSRGETVRLLRRYWRIPERQIETSIVLASRKHSTDNKCREGCFFF